MKKVPLANKLSILRILCIPFFIGTLIYYNPQRDYLRWISLGIFCVAALSDFFDGFFARKLQQKTTFGAIIDPLADKALLISSFITLAALKSSIWNFKFPTWIPIIIISRDAIILLGSALICALKKEFKILPTPLGKLTTTFQMTTIICIIANFKFAPFIWNTTVLITVFSGIQYITHGIKILNTEE
ncbi:MAG: CDP-alcohol phosphatidyltransferase family protein [Candidatus Omnitrophota bacterium]